MKFSMKSFLSAVAVALMMSVAIVAQPATNSTPKVEASSFTSKYEGVVKDETGETKLTIDIHDDAGKFSGTLTTPKGMFKIIKGQVADGTLTLDIERPGGSSAPMTLRQVGSGLSSKF